MEPLRTLDIAVIGCIAAIFGWLLALSTRILPNPQHPQTSHNKIAVDDFGKADQQDDLKFLDFEPDQEDDDELKTF